MSDSPEYVDPKQPQKRDIGLYATVFVALMFGVVFFSGPAKNKWNQMQMRGTQAPAFTLKQVKGEGLITLADYKGKVVLVDFWTTWCPPCRRQMPLLQSLHDDPKYKDKLVVLSVNADEHDEVRERKVKLYLKHLKLTMPAVYADPTIMKSYRVNAFPTMILIDRQGKVIEFMRGQHSEARVRKLVQEAVL